VRRAFPADLLPTSRKGLALGDFQLGYTLWLIFLTSVSCSRSRLDWIGKAVLFVAAAIILLLTPLPGWYDGLWALVPSFVRNVTGNWAMNRLYVVLASAIAVAGAILMRSSSARAYQLALISLILGAGWSFLEASKLSQIVPGQLSGSETAIDIMLSENVLVTRFAYLNSPNVPARFSHGVVAPELEYRLLSHDTYATIQEGKSAAARAGHTVESYDFERAIGSFLGSRSRSL